MYIGIYINGNVCKRYVLVLYTDNTKSTYYQHSWQQKSTYYYTGTIFGAIRGELSKYFNLLFNVMEKFKNQY
jgi:hypothetical protein